MTATLLGMAYEMQRMKLGLERIAAIHKQMGAPADRFASIHIGGTNGKGSVACKVATALQERGHRVGLYTSPHITDLRERICIDGTPIDDLDTTLERLLPFQMTYFETLTLAAFLLFAEAHVDYAVLEVGLGGRLDATNLVFPQVAAVTSIGWDHMAYLGSTLEEIAFEKGGIIKPGVPIVLGPCTHPRQVFEEIARQQKAPLICVEGRFTHFEEENCATARAILSCIGIETHVVPSTPPCRFEQHGSILLDVGHNLSALQALFTRLDSTFPNKKKRVLAAFSADKAINSMVAFLQTQATHLHLTQADHPRAHNFKAKSLQESFYEARALAQKHDELLVICGTFFMMDAIKKLI